MKDEEQKLVDEINTLKKEMIKDKKNKAKKNSSPGEKDDAPENEATGKKPFQWKTVLLSALPFLLIIAFLGGFLAGTHYEKGVEEQPPAAPGTVPSVEEDAAPDETPTTTIEDDCVDTDGGMEQFQKGTVYYNSGVFYDRCQGNSTLIEYLCSADHQVETRTITCLYCEDGACVQFEDRGNDCKESDNYVDFETKGYLIDKKGRLLVDTCSVNSLTEYYCDTYGFYATRSKLCDKCENGVCVPDTTVEARCEETDNGVDYYTRGIVTDLNGRTGEDNCQDRTLEEYYCGAFGYLEKTYKLCNQCVEGACLEQAR